MEEGKKNKNGDIKGGMRNGKKGEEEVERGGREKGQRMEEGRGRWREVRRSKEKAEVEGIQKGNKGKKKMKGEKNGGRKGE